MNPEVSVIMSVYNGEEHLDECIASISSQTFDNFEFIIVDDASTDNTAKILADWQTKDPRIRILHNQINQERCISRNRAITAAKAPLIAIMDADDIALPQRLAIQTDFFRSNPQAQLAGGDMIIYGTDQRWTHPRENDAIRAALFFDSALFHPTVMMRKSILTNTKTWYDPKYTLSEDYGMWAALLKFPDAVFANIPEVLTYYRLHDRPRKAYEDKQFYNASKVRNDILSELGIEQSQENMRCHMALLFGNAQLLEINPAKCAEYGNKLMEANRRAGLTTEEALGNEISKRLQRVFASNIVQKQKDV